MSPPIWTPAALRSETGTFTGRAWRVVEAQHRVSTLKLVDDLAEQELLEGILEDTKPPMPAECRHLDYLLATPFRYRPYPHGSRFRRAGLTPGVWYGAESPETAVAEITFYRFLFYAESPETPFPDRFADYTGFAAALASEACLDLTQGAFAADADRWTHLTDDASCQDLAESARAISTEIIRYVSVRDPSGGANLAVLHARVFQEPAPVERQSWRLRICRTGAVAICDHPRAAIEFPPDAFAADPRLSGMIWDRPPAR